jgi:hypothetical protein
MADDRFPYIVFDTHGPCVTSGTKVTGYVFRDATQAREFADRAKFDPKRGVWIGQARLHRVEGE